MGRGATALFAADTVTLPFNSEILWSNYFRTSGVTEKVIQHNCFNLFVSNLE